MTHYQTFSMELKPSENSEQQYFKTRIGLIFSCLGCVVGTGNIWRFPRIVANNSDEKGGLVFLIVWSLFLFLWSIPMLLIEYGTGRYTKKAIIGSFQQFMGEKGSWCGAWISMVTFFISCYYSVVLGWCFYYVVYCIANELPDNVEDSRAIFRDYAEESKWPLLTHAIALMVAGLSVIKGVKTIEKVNLFLVPILLAILLFTFIWSLTREYADYGIKYLFTPNWESFKEPRLWVDAISQNAFDTGAGMGIFIPYSSFMSVDNAIVKYGIFIPSLNNLISLICGMMIYAAVFSILIVSRGVLAKDEYLTILKDSGPASTGLTFIWIPVLFSTLGTFGRVLSILFFTCLSFAGITSLISNMELVTHTLQDFGVPRKFGTPATVIVTFLVGMMSALDINILTNQDFVWGFALVINGMMLQAMVIFYGTENFRKNLFNRFSLDDWKLPRIWGWMIKFVLPVEAVAIIAWWAIDLIDGETGDGEKWYEFGRETFVMTILQWGSLMLLVILVNCVVYFYRHKEPAFDKRPILDDVDTVMTDTKNPEKQGLSGLTESYKSIRL